MDINIFTKNNLQFHKKYDFNEYYHSYVFYYGEDCIIIDDNFDKDESNFFNYSDYCDMQNYYVCKSKRLFRFNCINEQETLKEVLEILSLSIEEIDINDKTSNFSESHFDNTPAESQFEEAFIDAFGMDSLSSLYKEVPLSSFDGSGYSIDYVVETCNGNYAFEANGINYHHPCVVGKEYYKHLLDKQNTMMLFGYNVYRFSTENMQFKDQMIDKLRIYLEDKKNFKPKSILTNARGLCLYEHQSDSLVNLDKDRLLGKKTSLIVLPTATGKSEIIVTDLEKEYIKRECKRVLIMVPSTKVKEDWIQRTNFLKDYNIDVECYNTSFIRKKELPSNYYDYILFDEAHHAQASNCRATLEYYNPKYLVGLTATDERLDKKKLQDIFGNYKIDLPLDEAIRKGIVTNIRCFRLKSNLDLSEIRFNGKDYYAGDLERGIIVQSRNELIAECLKKYFSPNSNYYKQGIVFCVNKEHCKRVAEEINKVGLTCAAVYSGSNDNAKNFELYENKEVQFLTSCQLISEGWDCPQTEIIVMARPTMSKVLYLQQIGRGLRHYQGKECLFLIDVVDEYKAMLHPWSFNSLFKIPTYLPFSGILNSKNEYLELLGLSEYETRIEEVDIFNFEDKYKDYLSSDEAARELYLDRKTLMNWNNKKHYASLELPLGNKTIPFYSKEDIKKIRLDHPECIEHTDEMILDDFVKFIDDNTLSFSFKLVFLLVCFKIANLDGEIDLSNLCKVYSDFYKKRINMNLTVDRNNPFFTLENLNNESTVMKNILVNPFEKFERKRFFYHAKDLNIIAFNPKLWKELTEEKKEQINQKLRNFLNNYYARLGGLDYEYNL